MENNNYPHYPGRNHTYIMHHFLTLFYFLSFISSKGSHPQKNKLILEIGWEEGLVQIQPPLG